MQKVRGEEQVIYQWSVSEVRERSKSVINQQGVYVEQEQCVRGSLLFCERAQEQVTRFYQVIIDAGGSPTAVGCLLMRCSGMGYREIGTRCSPPITRQGVEKHLRQARRRLRGLDRRGCLLFQAAAHLRVDKRPKGDETTHPKTSHM